MKIVDKNVTRNSIVSITVLLESPTDKAAYDKIDVVKTCPHCGKPTKPAPDSYKILIHNPLTKPIPGSPVDLGEIHTKCSSCGKEIVDASQYDLSAFNEVTQFLDQLRDAAKNKVKSRR